MAIDFKALGIELSEEQLKTINAAVTSEVDRARTQASQTAHNNANSEWEKKLPELISAAVAKETANTTKTAEQKIQEQYQAQIAELQSNYEALKAASTIAENKNKVRAAGISDDGAVEQIASMFATNPEGIDDFITVFNSALNTGIQNAKLANTNNATPPGTSNSGRQPVALTQDAITQMVENNKAANGGYVDDDMLFANLRVAQTSNTI